MNYISIIKNGIIKENPTFVLMLGMCPTLATTTSAINGLAMGLATMFMQDYVPSIYATVGLFIPLFVVN